MAFNEEDYLLISGMQHFAFCRRQWALIHLENQWAENSRTTEGELMHRNAHDAGFSESRGDLVIYRDLRVHSSNLGLTGACDVVEFRRASEGTVLRGREGLWQPFPIEYKRGAPKEENWDALQLCAEAVCLEEMLCCDIPAGALYYGETRHRQPVTFTQTLRDQVRASAEEMHKYFQRGFTPRVKPTKRCRACSLRELCLPGLERAGSAEAYLRRAMEEST